MSDELLLIKSGPDYIQVAIKNQPYLDSDYSYDRDWLNTIITVQLGAFSGTFERSFKTSDFEFLLEEFQELYKSLNHSFSFNPIEHQLAFDCKGDGIGHVDIDGTVMDQCGIGNQLSFTLSTDQSYLPEIIRQLEIINKAYPKLT